MKLAILNITILFLLAILIILLPLRLFPKCEYTPKPEYKEKKSSIKASPSTWPRLTEV